MEFFPTYQVNKGVNWRGFVGSVTMAEGEAQDCLDVLPREDGAIYKTFGWQRINDSALSGRVVGIKSFSYRGKNNTVSGDTARPGNFGLADDGADFTYRADQFSSALVLTTSAAYFWNPATETLDLVSLPGGVSVLSNPKPSMVVINENVYVVNWADFNLRYDPTDRVFYRWGWESAPAVPSTALAAGGSLIADATYKYAYVYFDVYTAEETTLGAIAEVTPTGSNLTVDLTLAAYSGSRHFNDLAVSTDSDVGIVVYRTGPDDETFYFLTTLNPGTTSFSDDGLALDTSLPPWRRTMQDEPTFTALEEFKGRLYALADTSESNRLYYSAFTGAAPFFERWEVRGYNDLPVSEGDVLTAIGKTDATLLLYTRRSAFRISVVEGSSAPQLINTKLPWDAGCIGPRARTTARGWEYWISDRGPYRWREGLVDPQWIGESVAPMFIDPTSGLCRLTEDARELSEVGFEWNSNTVRFVFAVGGSNVPNIHLAYWIEAEKYHGDPSMGWFPQSPKAQAMDLSVAFDKLDDEGKPPSGATRQERLVFGDEFGYVYEYDISYKRAGLKEGAEARFLTAAGGTTTITSAGGSAFFTDGDGMAKMVVEVLHLATGETERRVIASNTGTTITLESALDTATAINDIAFIGGIPAYWRSWVDHFGDPQAHKTVLHLFLGLQRTGGTDSGTTTLNEWILDVGVAAGDFPQSLDRERTVQLSLYRKKLIVSLTSRFFAYEVAQTRPDELFVLTHLQREARILPEKRQT